jgi:hypothetical protein
MMKSGTVMTMLGLLVVILAVMLVISLEATMDLMREVYQDRPAQATMTSAAGEFRAQLTAVADETAGP